LESSDLVGADGARSARIGPVEFVALMGTLTALIALSIDMILPALPAIGADLRVGHANDTQFIVSLLFLGFGLGQFLYGPVSDSVGRKPAVYAGLVLFAAGSALALAARTFPVMLAGRVLQGLGVAGPRTMTIALVRDRFEGHVMARVMSFVMAVFILVPVIAPSLGQAVLAASSWRAIFGLYLTLAVVVLVWFGVRQEETLPPDRRRAFSAAMLAIAAREVFTHRVALGYTVAAGLMYGAFIGYLTSVQQILQQQYALGPRFPLYFATLAIALGTASLCNARLVGRYGMRHLSDWAARLVTCVSIPFAAFAISRSGQPELWTLMVYLMTSFFGIGLLFGNLNALAMQPLGHIAGTGAAAVGGLQTLISLSLGTAIGQSYDGTVIPLVAGFAILSVLAMIAMYWAEPSHRRSFQASLIQTTRGK
jgi:DHA1 family bicyclomycin/chloramphenicol resistance-like MFS transporter